jgi:Lrp/AsnC family transcriptional regulator, leucine-responsive regulatory protein
MEDAGIITGFHASVAFEKAGYGITAIIRVSAPEENCTRLGALVRRLPCVVESYRLTGTDRLVIKVAALSVETLDGIVRELSQLGTVTVAIILSHRTHVVRPERWLSTT